MNEFFSTLGPTMGLVVLIFIAIAALLFLRGVYMWYSGMDDLIKIQKNTLRELVLIRITLEQQSAPSTEASAPVAAPPPPKAPSTVYIPLPFTKRPPQPPAG